MDQPLNDEELLKQRLHEVKLAMETEKSLRLDLLAENERLLVELNESKMQVESVKISLENEARSLKDKIINLTNEYETEKLAHRDKIEELEVKLKNASHEKTVNFDENECKKAIDDLIHEKQLRSDLENESFTLKEKLVNIEVEKSLVEQQLKDAMQDCREMREALEINKENLAETVSALKEAQEEKAMLTAEINIFKSGAVNDLDRGNSLFKEVEDNRKKLASAYQSLKNKYIAIKNIISVKNQEISRLKSEVASLKSRDIGLESALEKSKGALYESMKKRIEELETMVYFMEKWKESPEIVTISDSDVSSMQWVNGLINQAREETRKVMADYQKLSSSHITKAFTYRKTELELITLKTEMVRKNATIEQLELQVSELKSAAKENTTQSKTFQDDSVLTVKNTNKTVRFADDGLEETLCSEK